jgi:hypothetical protein
MDVLFVCRSEQKNVDNHGARGWEHKSRPAKKPSGVRFEGDENEDEEEEEDEMTEIDSQFSDDDYGDDEDMYDDEAGEGEGTGPRRRQGLAAASATGSGSGRSGAPKGKYASAPIDDDHFDRMLEEEYDSEEVGDLEEEVRRRWL